MKRKMALVILKQTQHILAAATRTANPDGKLKPEDLANGGLPIHVIDKHSGVPEAADFTLAADALDVKVGEYDEDIFEHVDQLSLDANDTRQYLNATVVGSVKLFSDRAEVTFSSAIPRDLKVAIHVEGGPGEARDATGTVQQAAGGAPPSVLKLGYSPPLSGTGTPPYEVIVYVEMTQPFVTSISTVS